MKITGVEVIPLHLPEKRDIATGRTVKRGPRKRRALTIGKRETILLRNYPRNCLCKLLFWMGF